MPALLIPVSCPRCQSHAVFLWCRGTEALCEKCLAKSPNRDLAHEGFKILIIPRLAADGLWVHGEEITFSGLRAFIDDCLDVAPRAYDIELLTDEAAVIETFMENLEARVPRRPQIADDETTQEHAVRRLRHRFEMWKRGELAFLLIEEVPWVILEPTGDGWLVLKRYTNRLNKIRDRYDWERLDYLNGLKPDRVCCGLGQFEGYIVFVFNACNAAVMECAKVGNAIYVVKADRWMFLSQRSKTELLTIYSHELESFPHAGTRWRLWLDSALRRRGIVPPFRLLKTTDFVQRDIESLKRALWGGWIEESDFVELESALKDDPVNPSGTFGMHVSAWIAKMIIKADEGMWHVPAKIAADLLTKALSRYYEFPQQEE